MNRKTSNVWSLYVELLCAFLLPALHPVGMRPSPHPNLLSSAPKSWHTHTHTHTHTHKCRSAGRRSSDVPCHCSF
ncbi:hypothetical protein IWZ03DRAFT_239111 [Phyllosticta citriasiana]|uniref:Secreted protein n=1 Tax=Phyllosticta citriasiana TaxID=595635 RepID=A0ABR1KKK3_9PEZI